MTQRRDILRTCCQRIDELEVHAAFECPGGPQPGAHLQNGFWTHRWIGHRLFPSLWSNAAGERRPTGTDIHPDKKPALWAVRSSGLLDAGAGTACLSLSPSPLGFGSATLG